MEKLTNLKYKIYNNATQMAASMTGPLKDSAFLEKGVLTPEEFVAAGDHLCHKCNTWQ
jgi:ubiquitin-like-conjugating enzyme ATG3